MTQPQITILSVIAVSMVLFVWNRWRYDIVALGALLIISMAGLVPVDEVFSGFGHPAVITVVAVLVISRGLINAGVVDSLSQLLSHLSSRPTLQVTALTAMVIVCSAVMNNVGALALLMPVAIWISRKSGRSPSFLLMPLAFGSLVGGTITLIGTPPNIIIAAFRTETASTPFGMFDFFPVGASVSIVALIFISLVGWRLIPERRESSESKELFQIDDYISEVRLPEDSKFEGQTLHDLLSVSKTADDVAVVGLIRNEVNCLVPSPYTVLRQNDILLVETDSASLKNMVDAGKLELAEGDKSVQNKLESDDIVIMEAVIAPESPIIGKSAASMSLRERHGINMLAVARGGRQLLERLGQIRFVAGDILLLQGPKETLVDAITSLECLPLAERGLRIGKPRKVFLAAGIFGIAIVLTAFNILQPQVAFMAAALVMVLVRLLTPKEAYHSIEWSVVVLLGAMIPLGNALETSGGAQWVADQLLRLTATAAPAVSVTMIVVASMILSNVINNAAAAVLMAPIAIGVAHGMGFNADPMLMAVAIGASCVFLTPIGHQSNALIMAPGGYRFSDYSRMGLPLSILVIAVAVPMILWFWPV